MYVCIHVDIDECLRELDDCDANATCTNTNGSYECQCIMGFTGDGKDCFRKFLLKHLELFSNYVHTYFFMHNYVHIRMYVYTHVHDLFCFFNQLYKFQSGKRH